MKNMDGNKNKWNTLVGLFHYREDTGMYKKLQIMQTDTGNIILKLSEGQKGQDRNYIIFQLSRQELAYLILQLQAIFLNTACKPPPLLEGDENEK